MSKLEDLEQQASLLQQNISYQKLGTFQKYFFFWVHKLFQDGATNQLTQKEIPKIPSRYSSFNSFTKFQKVFQLTNNLKRSLWKSSKYHIIQSCILYWLICTFQLFLPLILSKAQEFFIADQENKIRNIFVFAFGQLVYYLTLSILQPIQLFTQSLVSLQIQGVLQTQILNHTLSFPIQRSEKYTPGELINLLQVDVLQSSNYFVNKFQCYVVLYQLAGAFLIFYFTVRENSFIPAIGVVIQAVLGIVFGYFFGKIQSKFMAAKDERMSGVDESLSQIKQIKFNCYEDYFENRIKQLRGTELHFLKQQVMLLILVQFMQNMLSFSTWECTFYFSNYITFPITTVIIQNSSQLMYILQNFPNQLKNFYASKNSIKRVQEFFQTPKIVPWPKNEVDSSYALRIEGRFNWNKIEVNPNMLQEHQDKQVFNLQLDVIKGKFIAIIGNSASGKSTILKSIINETNCIDGKVIVNGQISLATQEPWIINDTIRNNIIYLDRYDHIKYKKVLAACALEEDINQFINKDSTQLSEKGDNLSGGQQKRINLARAAYKDADIYIFDDPLSALDVKVKCHINSECFQKLLQGKTRILFTNSTFNLQNVDEVYTIKDNQLFKIEKQFQNQEEQKQYILDEQFEKNHFEEQNKLSKASFIVNTEDQQVGRIENQVIKAIFSFQGGIWAIIVIIIYFAILMVLSTISNKVLSNPDLTAEEFRITALINFPLFNIPIYIAIISITGYFLLIGIKTSSIIHDNIFSNLLKASFTQFYNQILLGRLMNRLSKDIYNIDMLFPNQIYNLSIQFTNLIMPLITSLIFLNYIAYPIILIFVIVLAIYTMYYYKCLTELTRIESVSKSPVFAYYQQILRGLLYVRTCLPNQLVSLNHCNKVDLDLGNQFYLVGLQQWFSQTSGIITNIFQAILFIVCLLFPNSNPAMTFLVVIQMSNVSQLLVQVAVSCGNLLMYSISFERCLHLANNIEIEDYKSGEIYNNNNGTISFQDASFQYPNNQKDVLINLNLKIENLLKIGIVGRTGAGKSSIIMALTRMIEQSEGRLEINGIDFQKYNIKALRSQFSIIPQEALVFKGTLQQNIDPLKQTDPTLIEQICEQCQLFSMKSFSKDKLQTSIQQSGCNLSQGERQLIAIARCLLENRRIVLVDEATANIDIPTENLIKEIFQEKFQNKTMISIAHKVSTIMESDLIVVLNSGQIAELDNPQKLLRQPESEFKKIVDLINENL